MYRLLPRYKIKAYPQDWYPTKTPEARCIIHNIMNNLDQEVAQFPEELITYGGNGSVLSNWAQYHLLIYYLSKMTE
jgi:urocanate hydratase